MPKNQSITDITDGCDVNSLFLLEEIGIRTKRDDGRYLYATLADSTGRISCKIWGLPAQPAPEIEAVGRSLKPGEVYRIRGFAKVFNGECEININDGIADLAAPVTIPAAEHGDFVYSPVDIKETAKQIQELAGTIRSGELKLLVSLALMDVGGFYEKPAARKRHHNYAGGLAEHSLETARIAVAMAEAQKSYRLNRDILLAGAILHDIGKALSFERQGLLFVARPEYDLIGHIPLGVAFLTRYKEFLDDATYLHLLHIIQSHHGDHGDVAPRTPEAWAVHLADLASATLREMADDTAGLAPGEGKWRGEKSKRPVYRI
ncbi:MAG: HD domain-containing protein [Methanocalculus sp. MSAO_Arc1]|uniref:HD domain-containing protein n=1 Tax=Methanocalculus TaxID=71151 RepID=UPI000FEEE8F0|nr:MULTISPECIES: HD domain-containing protein [unclassified Methanocalculus]MCP1662177.1 3'-5' exoribonuclease [Methanocalculus sp. AMF5]RQD79094.1 MAG: HD domain-containing protein [Methanocalculus sp. MSAO_Arc1]